MRQMNWKFKFGISRNLFSNNYDCNHNLAMWLSTGDLQFSEENSLAKATSFKEVLYRDLWLLPELSRYLDNLQIFSLKCLKFKHLQGSRETCGKLERERENLRNWTDKLGMHLDGFLVEFEMNNFSSSS